MHRILENGTFESWREEIVDIVVHSFIVLLADKLATRLHHYFIATITPMSPIDSDLSESITLTHQIRRHWVSYWSLGSDAEMPGAAVPGKLWLTTRSAHTGVWFVTVLPRFSNSSSESEVISRQVERRRGASRCWCLLQRCVISLHAARWVCRLTCSLTQPPSHRLDET